MELAAILEKVAISHLIVTYQISEGGALPYFKGSTFRGVMGHALKAMACGNCQEEVDSLCLNKETCLYRRMFETPDEKGSFRLHPYIIRSTDYRTEYAAGDYLSFEIMTFGFVNNELVKLASCFKKMGDIGFGVNNLKANLQKIVAYMNEEEKSFVYDKGEFLLTKIPTKKVEFHSPKDEIIIEFVTPARIIHQGKLQKSLDVTVLLKNMKNRANQILTYYYPEIGEVIELDMNTSIEKIYDCTQVKCIERYSNRKEKKMRLDGVVGLQKYAGEDIQILFPLLKFAEQMNIGKSTSMGFGQIKIWK